MINVPMVNITRSSAKSIPQDLDPQVISLIEKGVITLNQAKKLTISWGHEYPTGTDTPQIDDYVLASTTGGCPMSFAPSSWGVGFLTDGNIPHGSPQNTLQKTSFDKVEKISLEEGKYFVRYYWKIFTAAYPSLWWRLAALRKGIIDPEGWLLSASQSDIDSYATDFDISYIKQRNFKKSINMDSENLFRFPYFEGKNYPSNRLCSTSGH